jgi:hypothetical protein
MHACTQAGMRACTRVRLHTQTHRHTHCHSMPSHVASAVACAYGGVRDSVQMRRCSRRQRCRQILCALLHRRTLLWAQARQRSCESRRVGLLIVREQWHSVRSLLVLNAAAQAAAQWTATLPHATPAKEIPAECALLSPCASRVHVEPRCAHDAAATSCALAGAARSTRAKRTMGHCHTLGYR